MKGILALGVTLSLLYGCSTAPQVAPIIEQGKPLPPKLLELCKYPNRYNSSVIEEVIIITIDNLESHINCVNRHKALVDLLKG